MEITIDNIIEVLTLISTILGIMMMIIKTLEAAHFMLPAKVAEPMADIIAFKPIVDKFIKFFGTDLKESASTKPLFSTEKDPESKQ